MNYTLVNFDELGNAITELTNAKEALNGQLNKIKGIIDNSVNNPDVYASSDARVTREQFEDMYNRWASKFDNYVQEYIEYFKKAKQTYEQRAETESGNAQKLNAFID